MQPRVCVCSVRRAAGLGERTSLPGRAVLTLMCAVHPMLCTPASCEADAASASQCQRWAGRQDGVAVGSVWRTVLLEMYSLVGVLVSFSSAVCVRGAAKERQDPSGLGVQTPA